MHEHPGPHDPRRLLSGRTLGFGWVLNGNRRETSIRFPELLHNHLDTWGDWGPMHSIRLHPHQQILIRTLCEEGNVEQISHVRPARLQLDSPMRAQERERTPLVLTLEDGWRGLRYRLGFSADGVVAGVDVTPIEVWEPRPRHLHLVSTEELRSLQLGGLA